MTRFRITEWPWTDSLPMPLVERWGPSKVGRGGMIVPDDIDEPLTEQQRWYEPDDELYLRELRELDLESAEAIAAFTAEFGSLGGTVWSDVIPPEWVEGALDEADPNEAMGRYHRMIQGRMFPELKLIAERGVIGRDIHDADWVGVFHPDEFRVRAGLVRDMTRVWDCYTGGLDITDVVLGWESTWVHPQPGNIERALRDFLVPALNHGLQPFHQRLSVQDASEPAPPPPKAQLYAALCLQLANHIGEDAVYRRCAHEGCSTIFKRQRGRAAHGQKRTDAIYCSAAHANASANREYRRRLKDVASSSPQRSAAEVGETAAAERGQEG